MIKTDIVELGKAWPQNTIFLKKNSIHTQCSLAWPRPVGQSLSLNSLSTPTTTHPPHKLFKHYQTTLKDNFRYTGTKLQLNQAKHQLQLRIIVAAQPQPQPIPELG
jgi:hypothetical protein